MDLISSCDGENIIVVGAGATTIVDTLLENDYQVTVMDISSEALRILSKRHGTNMNYIHGDLTSELELGEYNVWHDRAVLHFLLHESEMKSYVANMESCIVSGGYAVIETFSTDGAQECCGLNLHTYDEEMLVELLGSNRTIVESIRHTHVNQFGGDRQYNSTIIKRK